MGRKNTITPITLIPHHAHHAHLLQLEIRENYNQVDQVDLLLPLMYRLNSKLTLQSVDASMVAPFIGYFVKEIRLLNCEKKLKSYLFVGTL